MKRSTTEKKVYSSIFLEYGMMICVVIIFLIVFFQIIFRYFLAIPIVWSEEIARFFVVILTFLGFAFHIINDSHPRLTFFVSLFPDIVRRALRKLGIFIYLFISLVIVWQGTRLLIEQINFNRKIQSINIPVFYFTWVLPFVFLLSSVYLLKLILVDIVNFIRKKLNYLH